MASEHSDDCPCCKEMAQAFQNIAQACTAAAEQILQNRRSLPKRLQEAYTSLRTMSSGS